MKLAVVLTAVAALAGCTLETLGVNDRDGDDEVVLAPGETKAMDVLSIAFVAVKSDSRCPVDVVCVWQGDATAEIGLWVGMGPTHPFTLSLNGTPKSVTFAGREVTFVALSPEPRSSRVIKPEDYRARFRIRALPVE